MPHELYVHPNPQTLSLAAAERWIELAGQAIAERGAFHAALSGGSTPKILYETLARPDLASQVEWHRVHIYFGDERAVPPTHPDSNYRMAELALLRHVPIPTTQVHPMETDLTRIRQNARAYEELLRTALPKDADGLPVLDLVLLGLGPDGHIASLFPRTCALREQSQLTMAVYVDKLHAWRMTLTYPVIDRARHVMLLATGQGKAETVRRALREPAPEMESLPVQRLRPAGTMEWRLDAEAAALLSKEVTQ